MIATTPWPLLTSTMTVYPATWANDTGTSPVPYIDSVATAVSVQCMVQPTSSSDAVMYGRDTTMQLFDVFAAPTTTTGAAWSVSPADTLSIGGVTYRPAGIQQDLCNMGQVIKIVVEKFNG